MFNREWNLTSTQLSDEDSNEEVLPAFLDHARQHYTDELPPFIQEKLGPGILPDDQREMPRKTKFGNFSSSSTSTAKKVPFTPGKM